jgi:hypothetical protein
MQSMLRKFGIAAATVVTLAISIPDAANAAHWHGGGGHWHGGHGWGWGGFGVGLGTGLLLGAASSPYYGGYYGGYGPYYAYEPYPYGGCHIRRRLVHDYYGHAYWRRVRVCY